MLEFFSRLDQTLFRFINSTLANPVTDRLMPIVTSDWNLRILFVVVVLLILWKGSSRFRWIILFSVLTVIATDQLSSKVLKPYFDRPRPCQTLSDVHLLVNCGSGKSMPSSHAANAFGQALLFALALRRWRWLILLLAAIVAISRVFVGVHYPFDVLIGALIGSGLGTLFYIAYERFLATRSHILKT